MLNREKIEENIKKRGYVPPKIIHYSIIDSTNTRAKEYAKENPENRSPVVFIADEQTAGRGRRGRSFVSRAGAGIYISILDYPDSNGFDATKVTAEAAVNLAKAIESLCPCDIRIKWVNDLYLGGKKLAGILENKGYEVCTNATEADVVVFNTCAIRENAEQKIFGNIGENDKAKRR